LDRKIKSCLLTFDVEEWYQVENLRSAFPKNKWKNQQSTVFKNTRRIFDVLEKYNIKATFFILGLVAEASPELVKLISEQGHEIASHGTGHDLTYNLNENELYEDIKSSKENLEQLSESKILGYRAPNFSVNQKLIKILKDLNFEYDSSYNPFQLNKRYGKLEVEAAEEKNGFYRLDENFYEIPLSTVKVLGNHVPMAGGAYFRIFPFPIFKKLVKAKLNRDGLYHFYLHPWEFEPEQPKIKNIKLNYRLRHYTGLKKTEAKFEKLIKFLIKMDCQFLTISEYLNTVKTQQI
jgi:polysaccharide deacetylase family protein (PEP-CTERM system associated)